MVIIGRVSTKLIQIASLIGLLIFVQSIFAQNVTPKDYIAVVNGTEIPAVYFDIALKSALSHGEPDSADLRDVIKRKLITTTVLSQKSVHDGLEDGALVKASISQARQNILAEALISNFVSNNPVGDAEVKAEYERQIALLGPSGVVAQYQVSDIAVQSEEEASMALIRIKKGESFDKVAKSVSLAPNKVQGGAVGWVQAGQTLPQIASVLTTLSKGQVSPAPIQMPQGWYLIKLEDKKSSKPPTFEQAKAAIRNGLMQKKQFEFLSQLRQGANIVVR